AKAAGANCVVADKPIGERNNSPRATKKKLDNNHKGLANASVPPISPGNTIIKNEKPPKNKPKENFLVVEGCLSLSFNHNQAKNGAKITTNNGPSDSNHEDSSPKPKNSRLVLVSAKVARMIDPCSRIEKNKTAAIKSGIYAIKFDCSFFVVLGLLYIIIKY